MELGGLSYQPGRHKFVMFQAEVLGSRVRSAQPDGLQTLEILKTCVGQFMFLHDFLFSLVLFCFSLGFLWGFFPHPFLQGEKTKIKTKERLKSTADCSH